MFRLREKDEYIHPINEEPTWREAAYFDFYDSQSGFGALGYLGIHPNLEIGDQIFALWQGDVLLAKFTRWDFNIPRDIGEERFSFGPLHFVPRVPLQECDWYYDDGYCRLDITFQAIHKPYCWTESHDALARTDSHHYEQQGVYTGTVRIGREKYGINGVGVRDRAWGWGSRGGIKRWMWASGQFNRQFAFNTFHVTLANEEEVLYGYIYRGGENRLLQSSRVNVLYNGKSKAPEELELNIEGRSGDRLRAKGRIMNSFDISYQERNKQGYHFFCLTEYECEGLKGYGLSNHHYLSDEYRLVSWMVEDRHRLSQIDN